MTLSNDLAKTILMIGVYYKNNAPGGMAAVIQIYRKYFEVLNYIPSWKDGNIITKILYFTSAYLQTIFQFTFNKNIKIVHIHTAADQSFWRKSKFIKISKLFNKKVILHVHASRFKDFYAESKCKNKIVDTILLADVLIVLSESWKEWFEKIGIPSHKISIINNMIDYPQIDQEKSQNHINMLFLGEIGKRKGVFDVLKALSTSTQSYTNELTFRIGGNKNERELVEYIKSHQLGKFVQFEGWVANKKKSELLNWANLFILTSYNEGLPISILEAMSYGCAIISTNVGGIPEIVFNKKNGLLIQPGNIEGIKTCIDYFINNKADCIKYGNESKCLVKPYLPEEVLKKLSIIYSKLLNKSLQ